MPRLSKTFLSPFVRMTIAVVLAAGCSNGERLSAEEARRKADREADAYASLLAKKREARDLDVAAQEGARRQAERDKEQMKFRVLADMLRDGASFHGEHIETNGVVRGIGKLDKEAKIPTLAVAAPGTDGPVMICVLERGSRLPKEGERVTIQGWLTGRLLQRCTLSF